MQVGEVGAPAARDTNFLTDLCRTIENQCPASAFNRFCRTHESGRPRADDDEFEIPHDGGLTEAEDAAKTAGSGLNSARSTVVLLDHIEAGAHVDDQRKDVNPTVEKGKGRISVAQTVGRSLVAVAVMQDTQDRSRALRRGAAGRHEWPRLL